MIKANEVKIVRFPFLIPTWAAAQVVLPNTVWVSNRYYFSPRLLAHELVHIEQQRRYGIWRYWFEYACRLARGGYHAHKYELEAEARWEEYITLAREILRNG